MTASPITLGLLHWDAGRVEMMRGNHQQPVTTVPTIHGKTASIVRGCLVAVGDGEDWRGKQGQRSERDAGGYKASATTGKLARSSGTITSSATATTAVIAAACGNTVRS